MQVIVYSLLLMSASECDIPVRGVPNVICPDRKAIVGSVDENGQSVRTPMALVAVSKGAASSDDVEISSKLSREAQPRSNVERWVVPRDYPTSLVGTNSEGTTHYRVMVATTGRVSSCQITQSSGYDELDVRTCWAVRRRARFTPALDNKGNPITGTFDGSYKWETPE